MEDLKPGVIHIKHLDTGICDKVALTSSMTPAIIHDMLCKLSDVDGPHERFVCKLYTKESSLIGLGPNIPPNTSNNPYALKTKPCEYISPKPASSAPSDANSLSAAASQELAKLTKALRTVKDIVEDVASSKRKEEITAKPSMDRASIVSESDIYNEENKSPFAPTFAEGVTEKLKFPTFDIWKFDENDLMSLMEHMFDELGLIKEFKIDRLAIRRFLRCIKSCYNQNPFHNFRHCFCVTQMMYGIIHVTLLVQKLTLLERLILVIACIGHDLDHPGFNNAYQVNASTELALIYNDASPLENHHSAVLFTILRSKDMNLLANLSEADYKEARKNIINCILATDMAKHGEIIAKFKSHVDNFNYDDANQRSLLLQIIIKCSDISNEVRPKHVSEPWVDNLLEEFFSQSDKEKAEGLPTAPFMDRQKVTKPSAQVGFIGFVMIPLFELVAKLLPNMEEHILTPIKSALDYYKSLLEKK